MEKNVDSIFISASPYKKIHKEMLTPNTKKNFNQSDSATKVNGNPFVYERSFESKNLQNLFDAEEIQNTPKKKEVISDRYIPLRSAEREQHFNL